MPSNTDSAPRGSGCQHAGAYPEGHYPVLLAYGFRPFFILLPLYLMLSIVLWGLHWGGVVAFSFGGNPMVWHVYEMLFGLAGAGMAGFLLTAIPEFYPGEQPIVGKPLLGFVTLWVWGRVAFWAIDSVGVLVVAISHLGLMLWLVACVYRPILKDPSRRHQALLWAALLLTALQAWFFAIRLGWVQGETMPVLKLSTGAFLLLVLLVLRRVYTGVTNSLLESWGIDEVFLARPPRYNLAMFCIAAFSVLEYFAPQNPMLGWLALAAAAACLNLLNDFFASDERIWLRLPIPYLLCIPLLMALGYGSMGLDFLNDGFYAINHFRHYLTTGALGLAYLLVLIIVTQVHTGRIFQHNAAMSIAVLLLLAATAARVMITYTPALAPSLYLHSALLWAAAFAVYLVCFAPYLWRARVDGLLG